MTTRKLGISAAFLGAALLRVLAAVHYRIDSDETQHLHVVWGWTHGLLQYRDIFDNHMPVFHLLCAPLLRLFGERAGSLIGMRLAMLPIYAAALFLTYRIALTCYSRRDAIAATVIAAFIPTFFLTSSEFRPDTLWAVCWFGAILVIVSKPVTPIRAAAAGLLLGLDFAVSMKTSLLVVALLAGVVVTMATTRSRTFCASALVRCVLPLVAGIMIVPALIALYFASQGALHEFFYGTMGHNLIWRWKVNRLIAYPCLLTLMVIVVRALLRSTDDSRIVRRRIFLFVTTHFYGATLFCFWPLVEREHWLPYAPLAAIGFAPILASSWKRASFVAVQIALIVGLGSLWRDNTSSELRLIDATLRLTSPAEAVVDLKGETVFRHRAFRHVLEPITKERIRTGRLRDSLADDVVAEHALLAVKDDVAFPRHARRFLRENFIEAGAVRVAGCALPSRGGSFTIRIPAPYAVTATANVVEGLLDGTPYNGPRFLAPGVHTFTPSRHSRAFFVVWARAIERGFAPAIIGGP